MTAEPATSDPNSPVPAPSRPMPRTGNGAIWSEIVAAIERDQAKRDAEFKETAEDLNSGADDSRKDGDADLAELGAALDAADFAEALENAAELAIVAADGTLKLAETVHAAVATLHEAAVELARPEPTPNPPSRRGWRRIGWRRR